ncbi:Bestrophin, RFP-TM, chloride channel-domain-containing protein [Crepidotus variabilis]|uniref:Bestrophin, RFP-TM, chloride channel-domain-containing protein n=1 Tax=Crepidotus variabilis TaxID=179855 RepID=A0A9P6EQN2_9AGAR|nr:Bestrophin, RFP-TM, chloride channel-domain-containing protein [Crepidotus variabilis]
MVGTVKSTFSSVLPTIRAPRIRRAHLRKYSWLPDVFRLNGSIIGRIIGPVLTVTLFAAGVCYASDQGYKFVLSNSIVPLLSVVVGLILVFRNSTSYDRFWEGRKMFSSMTAHSRNMARMIWVNVGPPPIAIPTNDKGKTPGSDITHTQIRRRKIECLQLCLSFVVATKHYLRGEDGIHHADYQGILPASFARFDEVGYQTQRTSGSTTYQAASSKGTSREGSMSGRTSPDPNKTDATKRVRVKRSKQQLTDPSTPLLQNTRRSVEFHPYADEASLPLPLIIAHELSRKIYGFRRDGYLETVGPAGLNAINQMVSGFVDQMTAMERIANTPIPKSYAIHLKQCVTLYLFALPMTLAHDLGWGTVPLVTAVAFTFMGIEGIADEIEMPFGTDERDLPVDRYCQDLKEEIFYIIDRLPEGGEGFLGYDDGEGDD